MGISAKKLIFITGASRSGTTLMSFVLRRHSEVFALKELHYFGEYWDPRRSEQRLSKRKMLAATASMFARQSQGILTARPTPKDHDLAHKLLESLPAEDHGAAGLFASVAMLLTEMAGKSIPCEQTPRNIFYADALLKVYPDAYIIHMMRDPRAVMASQKQRWRRRHLMADKKAIPLSQSLRVWVNYHPYTVGRLWTRASREAQRLQDRSRFILVRFEDLLQSPEETIRHLCGRLNIEFEPAMLEIGQVNSSYRDTSQMAQSGFHIDAIETWRKTLSREEADIAERICGSLMSRFGYAPHAGRFSGVATELRYRLTYLLHIVGAIAVNPLRAWVQMQAALTRPTKQAMGGQDGL